MQELIKITDINAAVPRLHALDHRQSFSKSRAPVGHAITVSVFKNEDVIARLHARQCLRIRRRAGHIQAAPLIPGELGRLGHALSF